MEELKEEESQCYDLIGLTYFYKRDIEKAIYYHKKSMKGILEG